MKYITGIILFILLQNIENKCFAQQNLALNRACYQSGAVNYDNTAHLTTDGFSTTFWQSKPTDNEWIYVDLGTICTISEIRIIWESLYAKAFKIQVSSKGTKENPVEWKDVFSTQNGNEKNAEIKIKETKARYVRFLGVKSAQNKGYSIKEFEVYGTGGLIFQPKQMPAILSDGRQYLSGGNWKQQRASFVNGTGKEISANGFNDKNWIPATVPGTVLTSYLNIGAIPDPNYGDQQLMISDNFFTADFWYRNTFEIPSTYRNKTVWLNFDGINWKAEIFVNGNYVGRIDGAFIRGNFDITAFAKVGEVNALAVLIHKNDNPGEVTEQHLFDPDANGGIIGLDSPTMLAGIGWNWIPTIRGRNCGIWNHVFLSQTDAVSILNPFVKTDLQLPDTTKADISIEVTLKNNTSNAKKGILKASFAEISIEENVELKANEIKTIILKPSSFPSLTLKNPKLWWPNGYGNPNLYKLNLNFLIDNEISDQKEITFGIRKYTYSYDNSQLRILVNGYPIIVRGGNWGLPEGMLRCDKEGYDLRVRLHKEMNFNIIRNWIGMTGHREFYEACDKYGIMIWDDFWLANPVDGPHPADNKMFMNNVSDKILQFRNHASVVLWVGRNEGYPPAVLDSSMKVTVAELDPTRHYISSSAHSPVSGLGPYETKDPRWYFQQRGTTLHSEQGIVCVPSVESMKEMMPAQFLWPINNMWGKHDWTQPRVKIYTDDMNKNYGEAKNIEEFCRKAQFLNMEGPKAMIETWQSNRGGGVIVWMSHPAWLSLICQTYDYYFEPTAAYFAFKNGSEPLHILWRADNNKIQVANNTLQHKGTLKASIEIYDFSGKKVYNEEVEREIPANSITDFSTLKLPENISKVHFIKLQLLDKKGIVLSRNFYWNSTEYQNYTNLNTMSTTEIQGNAKVSSIKEKTVITVELNNSGKQTALMLRLKVQQEKSNWRVLPAFYSDNYISLVSGESRTVTIEFENMFLNGEKPKLLLEGWNITEKEINIK